MHIGHLILARYSCEQLGLDRVLFVPSGMPPHKTKDAFGASDADRVKMTKLAIEDEPCFELSRIEMDSPEITYTYLTVQKLKELYPDAELYFILGEDSLVDFLRWKNPKEIVSICNIAVGARIGFSKERLEETIEKVRGITGGDFTLVQAPVLEISSREIRKRIAAGKSVEYFVPEKTLAYIKKRGLYLSEE